MLLDAAFASRFWRAHRVGRQAVLHLPVIASRQIRHVPRFQNRLASSAGGGDRLLAFHEKAAESEGPEMPGQLLAIAQLPQVMGVAERMGAVGVRPVRFPVVMHRVALEVRQEAGGIIASSPRLGWTV